MRALSCTGVLPPAVICAFLSEWVYEPTVDVPVASLKLVYLQKPQENMGINLQWAILRSPTGHCYVVFRGSDTILDWLDNINVSLKGVQVPEWGTLLLHSGFWSAA